MIRQRSLVFAALWAALALGACGSNSPSPPGSSDPGNTGERITGNERLGWGQAAADAGELASFGYVAYVDNNRVPLNGVNCGPSGSAFQCSSAMPAMSPGSHTIELASYLLATNAESPRSAPIRVTLASATAGADPSRRAQPQVQTTADGVRLRLDLVTDAIEAPSAIAFSSDGLIVVGARRGEVYVLATDELGLRVLQDPSLTQDPIEPAFTLTDAQLTSPADGGLLDVALDPAFERNRLLYVLYAAHHADGTPRFTIARFREAAGRLGERATIVAGIPASADRPAGSLAFGRDGKLYAAFDSGGALAGADSEASYNGKVLRLNPDGTTPDDQPARSPVYMGVYRSPRGLDWHPVSGALWIADAREPALEELRVRQARIPLPAGTGAASIAFYRGELLPAFQGNLLVAAREGRSLLRLRLEKRDSTRVAGTERLFQDFAGSISALAVGPDGAIYLGSDRGLFRVGQE